ncbi:MAG: flagellar protein FlgN [Candidatus Adiutricales bacterium]
MNSATMGLMALINRQIENYRRLAGLIEDEQRNLIDLNLDQLRETVKAKEQVAEDIKLLVKPLAEAIGELARETDLPTDPLPTLAQLSGITENPMAEFLRKSGQTLARLKRDISTHNQDNRGFIEDALRFAENSLSILTGVKLNQTGRYQQTGLKVQSPSMIPMKLNKEI